jgi:hypothetical protein
MSQIINYLKKVFCSLGSKTTLSYGLLAHHLAKVGKCQSYVETFCRHADTIHGWIKRIYDVDIRQAYERQVRKALRKLNIRSAGIAIDFTHEPFYGKTRNLHTINVSKAKSHNSEFRYVTCCLLTEGKQIPLMALPVRYGQQVSQTIELLRYCLSLKLRIKYVVFDRGFYSAELIDFLQSKMLRYLMLVPAIPGRISGYKEQSVDFEKFRHQLYYQKAKSSWKPSTTIVVCKNQFGFDWMFASNIQLHNPKDYVLLYKRRWQIETNYRVEDEAKIKSKSCNYLIRYFYFMTSMLFHLLWIVDKNLNKYVQFKRYLDLIENNLLFDFLDVERL